MRFLLIATLLMNHCFAQSFNTQEIAQMEAKAHERIVLGETASFASDNFDIKYLLCRWEADPAVRYINGSVTIYFTAVTITNTITLDMMASLGTDSVKQRNTNLTFSQNSNSLQVLLSNSLNTGQLDSITVFYKGIPANTGFGSFIQSTHQGVPVMWTLSEPYGARDWWPCKNGLDDKADSMDIYITHPNIYKAASNGLLQSETAAAGNKIITHWKHRYPIATYLICFAITNYTVFNNTVQLGNTNLPMQTYCYPESLAIFQAQTPKVLNAMQFFNSHFGDYPFIKEKYGHVQFGWGGGMEHQTSTFLVTPNESLMAHELGHQWFGDKLTTNSWQDIWLNEGFATYLAAIYMEDAYPASAYANRQNVLANITSTAGGSVKVDDTSNISRIFSGQLSYNKGSYLVYMLRFVLGDSLFFKGIKNYLNDPALAYGFVRTANLQQHLQQAGGKDLTKFFKQWYEGEGYPSYSVQWSQLGGSLVNIKINQVTSHPSVSFFEMPVALQFRNATQQKTIILNNTFNGQQFRENIGFIADTVLIDPELWIISKNNSTQKVTATNTGQGIVDINPIPVSDPMQLFMHDFNASAAEIRIVNALGQQVYHRQVPLVNGAEIVYISTRHWAKGVYQVQILAGNKKLVKQVIR